MATVLSTLLAVTGAVGTLVTAVATFFLWRVTKTLAVETRRMADASAQPHIVATIVPSPWSMMHAELHVSNTGNATAYNIQIIFDPPIDLPEKRKGDPMPLHSVSVLKPGQEISSYLSEFTNILDTNFTVTTSWVRTPKKAVREENTYNLDMNTLKGIVKLGSGDPMIQIAQQLKHMREDWRYIASGFKKIGVDVFTAPDRLREQRAHEQRWRRESAKAKTPEQDSGSTASDKQP